MATLLSTNLPGLTVRRGKVRDLYDLGDDRLLMVATDRISTFDVVHPTPIPDKGRILTQLSWWWFGRLADLAEHHVVSANMADLPATLAGHRETLQGRALLVRKAAVIPIECVARGYLAGSSWRDYQASGAICGVNLPPGLPRAAALSHPIFTPATKAAVGHDENITAQHAGEMVGHELMAELAHRTLAIYLRAADYAASRGLIVADTKLEWGHAADGRLMLIDEALTPDSSRFWPADSYRPGHEPQSFDKQYVRDYVTDLGWDRRPPAPPLPDDVVARTRDKYLEAYERLTGQRFV